MFAKRTMFASVAVFVVTLLVEPTGALLMPATKFSPTEPLTPTTARAARRQNRRYYYIEDRVEQSSMTTPVFSCSTMITNEVQRQRRGRAAKVRVRYRLSPSTSAMLVWRVGARGTARQGSRLGAVGGESSSDEDSDTRHKGADGEKAINSNGSETPGAANKKDFDLEDGQAPFLLTQEDRKRLAEAGNYSGTTDSAEDNGSSWWPRLFPPAPEDGDEPRGLIELPLDGVLLQLFPALLIGVLGLVLTVAVQLEAGRFDGMVGEDGGAVAVTDLRAPREGQ